jgi:hypothetical protein
MIYIVTCAWSREPTARLRRSLEGTLDGMVEQLSHEELLMARRGPVGHYVFTDLDRLSRYERDGIAAFAAALARRTPDARILNAPARAIADRTTLLLALQRHGINDFGVARLQDGERPARYPVFIRAADAHDGPESDLLDHAAAFDAAVAELQARGIPLAGRIAVDFAAERSADGLYRKYGVFNVGGRLIPQHVMQSESWSVKSRRSRLTESAAAEELAFVLENPHADTLARVFALAGIDFGRVDYGLVNGRPQIYEINTQPHFPRFEKSDLRSPRRRIIRERLVDAFRALDRPLAAHGTVRFDLPAPQAHPLRLPLSTAAVTIAPRAGRCLVEGVVRALRRPPRGGAA